MPPAAAVGVGVGLNVVGGIMGAKSAQDAANSQQSMAMQGLNFQKQAREDQIGYATQDFGQMAAINTQLQNSYSLLNNQIDHLNQQYQLYQQVGGQASALLNGQAASSLAPMQNQIARQQQMMENQLRNQLGSGYSSSSSGIEAQARFNQQASDSLATAQQQAIGNYIGYAGQLGNMYNQGMNQAYATSGNLAQQAIGNWGQQQQMRIGAASGANVNYNNAVSTAGAGSTAGMFMGGALGSIGGAAMGAGLGGMFSGGFGGGGSGGGGLTGSSQLATGSGGGYHL